MDPQQAASRFLNDYGGGKLEKTVTDHRQVAARPDGEDDCIRLTPSLVLDDLEGGCLLSLQEVVVGSCYGGALPPLAWSGSWVREYLDLRAVRDHLVELPLVCIGV